MQTSSMACTALQTVEEGDLRHCGSFACVPVSCAAWYDRTGIICVAINLHDDSPTSCCHQCDDPDSSSAFSTDPLPDISIWCPAFSISNAPHYNASVVDETLTA